MSDNKDNNDQGVHYHYHFYGYGQPAPNAEDTSAQAPAGEQQAPNAQAPFPGAPFPGGPGMTPPPGFPFPPSGAQAGPQAGAPGANGAATGATGGFNWHQHPNADSLVKGLAVGAGAAYLLTNETAQRTIMRTAVQVWALLQNGIEELKERLHDAEAEVAASAQEPAETEITVPAETAPSTTTGS